MPTILITGSNRGIGKRLTELYHADGWDVIAASRDPATATGPGEKLTLDITDPDSVAQAAASLDGRPIDILWNNAGVYLDKGVAFADMDGEAWARTFHANTIAPMLVCQALMGNVAASDQKKIAFTSSRMASLAKNTGGGYAYRASKAALNMAVSCLVKDVAPLGVMAVLLHPGWVKTDMGGSSADIDTDTSATGMKAVVTNLTAAQSGHFINYDGTEIPW